MFAQGKHAECIRDYVAFKNAILFSLLFDLACDEQVKPSLCLCTGVDIYQMTVSRRTCNDALYFYVMHVLQFSHKKQARIVIIKCHHEDLGIMHDQM